MIPLSVPEIDGGYPERYGGEEEGEEGEGEEEGLVLEYSRKLDIKVHIRFFFFFIGHIKVHIQQTKDLSYLNVAPRC